MAEIGKDNKDREIYDFGGYIWEGIWMAKNGDKKGVSMALQAKEGLEQLKGRAISETTTIKVELGSAREGI